MLLVKLKPSHRLQHLTLLLELETTPPRGFLAVLFHPRNPLPIFPQPHLKISFIRVVLPDSLLLAIHPVPGVLPTVVPFVDPIALFLILKIHPIILAGIGPKVLASALHLVHLPHALINLLNSSIPCRHSTGRRRTRATGCPATIQRIYCRRPRCKCQFRSSCRLGICPRTLLHRTTPPPHIHAKGPNTSCLRTWPHLYEYRSQILGLYPLPTPLRRHPRRCDRICPCHWLDCFSIILHTSPRLPIPGFRSRLDLCRSTLQCRRRLSGTYKEA